MMRTVENWCEVIEEKQTPRAIAEFLIGDLFGYRSSSIHRKDDERHVENLIKALCRVSDGSMEETVGFERERSDHEND